MKRLDLTPLATAAVAAAFVVSAAPFAHATVTASKILLESAAAGDGGDSVASEPVTVISTVAGIGGIAANIRTSATFVTSTSATDRFYGGSVASPGVLFTEAGASGGVTAFGNFFGYASGTNSVGGLYTATAGQVAYQDTAPVMTVGGAIPGTNFPGQFYGLGKSAGITGNGTPYFYAGVRATAAGADVDEAIFVGTTGTPLIRGGATVGGLPNALRNTANVFSFNTGVSANTTNYVTTGAMVTGTNGVTTSNDVAVIRNGSLLSAAGTGLREGEVMPAALRGNGTETYQNWGALAVNNANQYLVAGDTNAATSADSFLIYNGATVFREGDLGVTGNIDGVALNENGDWAAVVGNVLFINGGIAFGAGQPVNINGTLTTLTSISGSGSTFGFSEPLPDGNFQVTFVGRTALTGTRDALLTVVVPEPSTAAVLGLAALGLVRRRRA